MADDKSYPKIPESTWWALRAQFQKSYPGTVTKATLISTLKLTEAAATNLLIGIKRVGLLDDDGKTNARSNNWRIDTKYAEVCKTILEEVYPVELREAFPDGQDKAGIKQWFSHTCKVGDVAARQMTAVYILLAEKQIKSVEEKPQKPKTSNTKKTSTAKPQPALAAAVQTIQEQVAETATTTPPIQQPAQSLIETKRPSLHIDLQIHISPDASTDQIEAIFASMAKHLYK